MMLGAPVFADVPLARDPLPYRHHYLDHNPRRDDSGPNSHAVDGGSRGAPLFAAPCAAPPVVLELWRHSAASDDWLAVSQLSFAHEKSGDVVDRVVRLTSASLYSVQFALRVRVALMQADCAPLAGYDHTHKINLAEIPVLWGS